MITTPALMMTTCLMTFHQPRRQTRETTLLLNKNGKRMLEGGSTTPWMFCMLRGYWKKKASMFHAIKKYCISLTALRITTVTITNTQHRKVTKLQNLKRFLYKIKRCFNTLKISNISYHCKCKKSKWKGRICMSNSSTFCPTSI